MLGVEMGSTGEVGCVARTFPEALLLALSSTGFRAPRRGVLLSLGPRTDKFSFAEEALVIRDEFNLPLYATAGTAEMLGEIGIKCVTLSKGEGPGSATEVIDAGLIDLIINIPVAYDDQGRPDGYLIRRAAIDAGVTLLTDLQLARAVIEMLRQMKGRSVRVRALSDVVGQNRLSTLTSSPRRASAT